MKMFRIILQLNDYPLLRKLKARMMADVSESFFALYPGLSSGRIEGSSLVLEVGDIAADFLAEGIYRFYRELVKKRLLLHGFVIGVDYSPSSDFSILSDGKWSVKVPDLDLLYLTESANEVLMSCVYTEGSGPLLQVTGISEVSCARTQPFLGLAEEKNRSLVRQLVQFLAGVAC